MSVAVIHTGVANTASVVAALRRCGAEAVVTDDAGRVASAPHAVLPGVGAFGAGMEHLNRNGLGEAVCQRIADRRPTLAVCLGLQLLCARSDESPGVAGLGVLPLEVRSFPPDVRVPQFGWNRVETDDARGVVAPGHAYFANSFRLDAAPPGWSAAWSDHGGRFIAALERGPILACQFHPELSGRYGLDLVSRWLKGDARC